MLEIKGETRGDYFHIICKKCNESRIFNLMLDNWKDIKGRAKKRSQSYFRMQARMIRAREEHKG